MNIVDLIRELDSFIHEIKDREISDYDLENYLREILGKYGCFHFRTVYRSVYYVVFVFECENYTVEVRVEYCECNKVTSIEYEVLSRVHTRFYRKA